MKKAISIVFAAVIFSTTAAASPSCFTPNGEQEAAAAEELLSSPQVQSYFASHSGEMSDVRRNTCHQVATEGRIVDARYTARLPGGEFAREVSSVAGRYGVNPVIALSISFMYWQQGQ